MAVVSFGLNWNLSRHQSFIYILYKGEPACLFVCLHACFSQTESQIATEFSQHIQCTKGKKLMEAILIDFPLALTLGFVVPSLFEGSHFYQRI